MNFSEPLKLTTPFDSLWTFFLSSGEITRSGSMGWNSKSVLTDKWTPPRVTGIPVYTREDKKKKTNWSELVSTGDGKPSTSFLFTEQSPFLLLLPCHRLSPLRLRHETYSSRVCVPHSDPSIWIHTYKSIHLHLNYWTPTHDRHLNWIIYIYTHIFLFHCVKTAHRDTAPSGKIGLIGTYAQTSFNEFSS